MKRKESLKTLLIFALLISAVYLTNRAWSYTMGASAWDLLWKSEVPTAYTQYEEYTYIRSLLTPLRAVVRNETGLCTLTESNAVAGLYERTQAVLNEALVTAQPAEEIAYTQWKQALASYMVLYDYEGNVPLDCIGLLAGTGSMVQYPNIRYLLLQIEADTTVSLYYQTEEGTYYRSRTEAASAYLYPELLSCTGDGSVFLYEMLPGNACFVTGAGTETVKLTGTSVLGEGSDKDRVLATVLESLGFNAYLTKAYPEADATRVYVEELDTLRVSNDGKLRFYSPTADTGEVTEPNVLEKTDLLARSAKIVQQALSPYLGDAKLFLRTVYTDETSGRFVLLFGISVNGVVVECEDGYVASLEFCGRELVAADMKLLSFRLTEETEQILPLRQAYAAAGNAGEMALRYTQSEDGTYLADWYLVR